MVGSHGGQPQRTLNSTILFTTYNTQNLVIIQLFISFYFLRIKQREKKFQNYIYIYYIGSTLIYNLFLFISI